jgi:hypothetical protein
LFAFVTSLPRFQILLWEGNSEPKKGGLIGSRDTSSDGKVVCDHIGALLGI